MTRKNHFPVSYISRAWWMKPFPRNNFSCVLFYKKHKHSKFFASILSFHFVILLTERRIRSDLSINFQRQIPGGEMETNFYLTYSSRWKGETGMFIAR